MAALPPALALAACGGGGNSPSGIGVGPPVASAAERRVKVSTGPDVSLQVRDWQKPGTAGPVIVLLAGLGGNARYFDSLAPALTNDFSRVVAISRRGYGLSGKPLPVKSATQHYEVDDLTADLKAVLDDLGLQRVVLAGHSIAGNELTRFAGRFPERVQGLVYLDTSFDYTVDGDTGGEELPTNKALAEPVVTPADNQSMQTAIAFQRRKFKGWWPPLEANLRDALDVQSDGSVRPNTPESLETAMDTAAHKFSPDYTQVRTPSLVITALFADNRDLMPWLEMPLDAKTGKDAADFLRIYRRARITDANRLVAALKTPHHVTLDNCSHGDFLMEREADVLRAIRFMTWA
ncbi:alpha/beta hydrolase [Variovorax sp. ZS18.2.2]|uniref:alpha/beta fold hydrolase n=1 Tax=Variovorax sp. ZS18.2.2 TaxID=2971255 RepID=UPI002151DEF3|nr:alpha/beta hydrolase [Variovorax sp. ZS18.2.2]MCR6477401.1 alpha/beta hydrolase [Variovorax sp. ZS18.2.2]